MTSDSSKLIPSRRRFGLAALLAASLLSGAGGAVLAYFLLHPHDTSSRMQAPATLYRCPMHPKIVQDHPGNCPICGMKLVLDRPAAPAPTPQVLFYRSPMNPAQTSPTPRKDEMGMDYVPVYEESQSGDLPPWTVAGLGTVRLSAERQQLIGVRTTEVTRGLIGGSFRTLGRVAVDATRIRQTNVKVSGYAQSVFADFVGKSVRRGEPLFTLLSPEILAAEQEYVLALRSSSGANAVLGGDALTKVARRRLTLLDVPSATLTRLARGDEPSPTLTFYSPISGVVTRKDIVEGAPVPAGSSPYEIVDLSVVWVVVDVRESEMHRVHEGMQATLALSAYPTRAFSGHVDFIEPSFDTETRTLKVRLAFENSDGVLRPGLSGEVLLVESPHEGLRVPEDAVIATGTEQIVFVATGRGVFEPRTVELGDRDGDFVEVRHGLTLGEQVVTRANFLIDSESRLRAAIAPMQSAGASDSHARVLPAASVPKSAGSSSGSP